MFRTHVKAAFFFYKPEHNQHMRQKEKCLVGPVRHARVSALNTVIRSENDPFTAEMNQGENLSLGRESGRIQTMCSERLNDENLRDLGESDTQGPDPPMGVLHGSLFHVS